MKRKLLHINYNKDYNYSQTKTYVFYIIIVSYYRKITMYSSVGFRLIIFLDGEWLFTICKIYLFIMWLGQR